MTPHANMPLTLRDNGVRAQAVLISVVVPFKDYDVHQLATELVTLAARSRAPVEILFADDGSTATAIREGLVAVFEKAATPCGLLIASSNLGRALIRNQLAVHARGAFLLFLDADMLPDRPDYLDHYVELARTDEVDVVYGGRSYARIRDISPDMLLYHEYSRRAECLDAGQRQRRTRWYVMTNNLLVRRRLILEQPFSGSYVGWGYEDMEWALRVDTSKILHIDNTASHMGLISSTQLLSKIGESRENFRRIAREAPAFRDVPIYRVASRLAHWPLLTDALHALSRRLLLIRTLPLIIRFALLQGFRLATYASALRSSERQ